MISVTAGTIRRPSRVTVTCNLGTRPETCDSYRGTNQEPRQRPQTLSIGSFLTDRSARLRQRIAADRTRSARDWVRSHRILVALGLAGIVGFGFLDSWLVTCGFEGCPSKAEIRAYHPSEGGRILDRNEGLGAPR